MKCDKTANLFFSFVSIGYPKTALRQEELTNDILCATHAYDATPCHHLVGEKWGKFWFQINFV